MLRSYDGYRMEKFSGAEDSQESHQKTTLSQPLMFDMSARIKVKQDYLKMVEQAEEQK